MALLTYKSVVDYSEQQSKHGSIHLLKLLVQDILTQSSRFRDFPTIFQVDIRGNCKCSRFSEHQR